MSKTVYENRADVAIDGKQVPNLKSVTVPRELGYVHEDDLNGGGVVQEVSAERLLRFTYGIPRDGDEFDFGTVENSNIVVTLKSATHQYSNCYIKTIGEPEFSGSGAATRAVEIIVGARVKK